MATDPISEFRALEAVISALQPLDAATRRRIFGAAATFLELDSDVQRLSVRPDSSVDLRVSPPSYPAFSEDAVMSPKDFLFDKQPQSDIERVAVLAFYLTHYRDTPQFKTLDLSKLNTEAAQPKFSNAAQAANNAVKRGFIVPTTRGQRQLSAAGERFVSALPDRDAARQAMAAGQPARRRRTPQKRPSAS